MIPRLIFRLIKHRIKWILIVFILRLFCVSADVSRGNPDFEMIQICKNKSLIFYLMMTLSCPKQPQVLPYLSNAYKQQLDPWTAKPTHLKRILDSNFPLIKARKLVQTKKARKNTELYLDFK